MDQHKDEADEYKALTKKQKKLLDKSDKVSNKAREYFQFFCSIYFLTIILK